MPYEDLHGSIQDTTLQSGHRCYFRVRAIASGTAGLASVTLANNVAAAANPGGTPNRPFNLAASAVSPNSVNLSFCDNCAPTSLVA